MKTNADNDVVKENHNSLLAGMTAGSVPMKVNARSQFDSAMSYLSIYTSKHKYEFKEVCAYICSLNLLEQ